MWTPALPEVTSLLVVEIVAGRSYLPQQMLMLADKQPKIYPAGGDVGPQSLNLTHGLGGLTHGFISLWGPVCL